MTAFVRPSVFAVFCAAALMFLPATGADGRQPPTGDVDSGADGRSPQEALRAGLYDEAEAGFRAMGPEDAAARLGLGRTLRMTGRYEEALEALGPRTDDSRADLAALALARGRVLAEVGRIAEAEAAFRSAAGNDDGADDGRVDPGVRLEARYRLGKALRRLGRAEEGDRVLDGILDAYNRSSPGALPARALAAAGAAAALLGPGNPGLYHDAFRVLDEASAADPDDPLSFLLAGELLLDRHSPTEAARSFRSVLEKNPRDPRALYGLARALAESSGTPDPPAGGDPLAMALAVNPRHPPARALLLTRGPVCAPAAPETSAVGATGEDRSAWPDPPESPETLAARAVARFAEDDRAGLDGLEAKFVALAPGDGGFHARLATAAEQRRRYGEAAAYARSSLDRQPDSAPARRLLGLNLIRHADGVAEGRSVLTDAFAADPFDALLKNTLDLLDDLHEPERFSVERFGPIEIVLPASEAAVLGRYARDAVEEALADLEGRYGRRRPDALRVELYDRSADFSVRTVGFTNIGAHGVCFGSVIAMESPSARRSGEYHWVSTLWHELAHTVVAARADDRVPRWFTEGLAVREERRRFGDGVTLPFLSALAAGALLDVGGLEEGFICSSFPGRLAASYYHASIVIELIESRYGFEAIPRLLDSYGDGSSDDEAFRAVLGRSAEELDAEVDAHLAERYGAAIAGFGGSDSGPVGNGAGGSGAPPSDGPDPDRAASRLAEAARDAPDDFVLQLRAGRALHLAERDDEAIPFLERAAEILPDYGGADGPLRWLGFAHARAGRLAEAEARLAGFVARAPAATDARLRLAGIREELGDVEGAAAALQEAVEANPLVPEPHERLAAALTELGRHADAVRERESALLAGPTDPALALYELARAHHLAGDRAAARRRVLEALAIAPRYPEALALLLDLRESPPS